MVVVVVGPPMHMFIVLVLPAYKWLPPFAADV